MHKVEAVNISSIQKWWKITVENIYDEFDEFKWTIASAWHAKEILTINLVSMHQIQMSNSDFFGNFASALFIFRLLMNNELPLMDILCE